MIHVYVMLHLLERMHEAITRRTLFSLGVGCVFSVLSERQHIINGYNTKSHGFAATRYETTAK